MVQEKIPIGISLCQFGANVRYDKTGNNILEYIGEDKEPFVFYPICPELQAGMSVPRLPIHVSGESGKDVWHSKARIKDIQGKDYTIKIKRASVKCMKLLNEANVRVFIYTEKSPTCGVYKASVKGKRLSKPPGVFGDLLFENNFFLIPSSDLKNPMKWWDWRRRLFTFLYVDDFKVFKKSQMLELWHKIKYIMQEIDEVWEREMGSFLATHIDIDYVEVKKQIINILRKPSTHAKIVLALENHCKYYKEEYKFVITPEKLEKEEIAAQLIIFERNLYEKGLEAYPNLILYKNN